MPNELNPDPAAIRRHLKQVFDSEHFTGARRLQEFLSYIVEEKLAGREDGIRGKTIAADIYGRGADIRPENKSVVRVDAGRLRRRLDSYYQTIEEPLQFRIEIPVGGYTPKFVVDNENGNSVVRQFVPAKLTALMAAAVILLLGIVSWLLLSKPIQIGKSESVIASETKLETEIILKAKRRAMFAKSPASLQAFEFSEQARELIFPPTDGVRLGVALKLFKNANVQDENYFGGYAGAAQVYAFMALAGNPTQSGELLEKAGAMAHKAQELAPSQAWVQTSLAWIAFVAGDFNRATELADQAAILDPHDDHNRDFHGMIAGFNGDFEKAIRIVEPYLNRTVSSDFVIHRNIFSIANFHLGNYGKTIKYIDQITESGGASNPLTTTYLAAAYQSLGKHQKAREMLRNQRSSWPEFQTEKFVNRIFRYQKHADQVLIRLREIER
jgi:tetratricopeptide (TPR) repeat protein